MCWPDIEWLKFILAVMPEKQVDLFSLASVTHNSLSVLRPSFSTDYLSLQPSAGGRYIFHLQSPVWLVHIVKAWSSVPDTLWVPDWILRSQLRAVALVALCSQTHELQFVYRAIIPKMSSPGLHFRNLNSIFWHFHINEWINKESDVQHAHCLEVISPQVTHFTAENKETQTTEKKMRVSFFFSLYAPSLSPWFPTIPLSSPVKLKVKPVYASEINQLPSHHCVYIFMLNQHTHKHTDPLTGIAFPVELHKNKKHYTEHD